MANIPKNKNVVAQFFWLLRHRRAQVFQHGFGYLRFHLARVSRSLMPLARITLGSNVRLQSNISVMAERPEAWISIGDNSVVYEDARLLAYGKARIDIGPNAMIGGTKIISRYKVTIGARFLSSWNVFIQDFDPHPIEPALRGKQVERLVAEFRPSFGAAPRPDSPELDSWTFPGESIVIGSDVWVGADCTILKGAQIGDGCIVAAGALVLRGIYPPGSVLAGNPAVIVKQVKSA